MSASVCFEAPLQWAQIAAVAEGRAQAVVADAAAARVARAHDIVQQIVAKGMRAYGVNTGVGALSDVAIAAPQLAQLSCNILMSHAVGVGVPLEAAAARAVMAAMVNNYAHGYSGVQPALVAHLVSLLNAQAWVEIPTQGSVGYLSHAAYIGLALIGHGWVHVRAERLPAAQALAALGLQPLVLGAKEGLSLVNGTPCATGFGCLAIARAQRLLAWANAIAALSFEALGGQISAISPAGMALRPSPGACAVADNLALWLESSAILAGTAGKRTQDALSLRGIPHVHGAALDAWQFAANVVDRELASVTDNPAVFGSAVQPEIVSQAHAMGPAIGQAMDQLGVALAQLGLMAERRLDRMVNPLVSGLPAFLAAQSGVASGFMIAQYSAVSLVAECRRLAAPASLDGGITSGLQEDMLCHATPAALKALQIIANLEWIFAIEYLVSCQALDMQPGRAAQAARTARLYTALRETVPAYADDRPLGDDIATVARLIRIVMPE